MSEPDHYRALGVPRYAPADSVRRAYIALVKRHHPDANGGVSPESGLAEAAKAYWELRHPERRAAYDNKLRAADERRAAARRHRSRRTTVALQPSLRAPRRGTRALFALSALLLAGTVGWVITNAPPAPGRIAQIAAAATVAAESGAAPRAAQVNDAALDYQMMRASVGPSGVAGYVAQCFAEMAAVAPPAVFDYCVAFEALAAADAQADPYFSPAARRARLSRVAFTPRAVAPARAAAIGRLVAAKRWPRLSVEARDNLAGSLSRAR